MSEEPTIIRYKCFTAHFQNGDIVSIDNPTLMIDREDRVVFKVGDESWWFNLSNINYTIIVPFDCSNQNVTREA